MNQEKTKLYMLGLIINNNNNNNNNNSLMAYISN